MNLKTRHLGTLVSALTAATLLTTGCDTTQPQQPISTPKPERHEFPGGYALACAEGAFDPGDFVNLGVVYPNGGETFHVGDTVAIGLCMEDVMVENLSDGSLYAMIGNSTYFVNLYDLFRDQIQLSEQFVWIIPDSVDATTRRGEKVRISMVTDSCRIRVSDYDDPGNDWDMSDGMFRILKMDLFITKKAAPRIAESRSWILGGDSER